MNDRKEKILDKKYKKDSQKYIDKFTKVNYTVDIIKFTFVNGKENKMENKYMMDVYDVMNELGVKKGKAYAILRQLNEELEKDGYKLIRGKIPRPYWETKFYGYTQLPV